MDQDWLQDVRPEWREVAGCMTCLGWYQENEGDLWVSCTMVAQEEGMEAGAVMDLLRSFMLDFHAAGHVRIRDRAAEEQARYA